jgi:cell division protein FtsQ
MRLAMVGVVVLAGLLFGAWAWLRDSSLASVDQVTITGESGGDAGAIRSALRSAARNMTTLDVHVDQLRTAVAPFPEVRRLRVRTAFPHRMVIEVIEQRPVALIDVAGRQIPVAGDGTILRAVTVGSALPAIPLSVLPVGRHLREGGAAQAVALLATAPYELLSKISQVTSVSGHGLVAQVRNGPSIYFGDTTQVAAKWVATTDVLGDPASAGAAYVDVTDPSRPAAGAGTSATGTTGPATASAAPTAPVNPSASPTTTTNTGG